MSNLIFIVGPTATGKTEVAFELARRLGAEIISCDSMLVYREPQIITSKPAHCMLEEIKHHFIDIISVKENYSVFDYYVSATAKLKDLLSRKVPVVACGGSGLYIKAMLDGLFQGPGKDEVLRKQLEERALAYGKENLLQELKKVDPETAAKVSDLRRIIRALEVYSITGIPLSKKKKEAKGLWGSLPIKIFGLSFPRETLYERIDKRVDTMFEDQAVKEVGNLLELNLSLTAQKIIGIKEIKGFLHGEYDIEEAKNLMKKNTRHFAKRQLTWFNAEKRIEWIDIGNLSPQGISEQLLKRLKLPSG